MIASKQAKRERPPWRAGHTRDIDSNCHTELFYSTKLHYVKGNVIQEENEKW